MNFNKTLSILSFLTFVMLLQSCVREKKFFDFAEGDETSRSSIKILEAPENKLFFEPFSGTRNVYLFSLRRDVNNESELNKSATVTVRVDTAAIRAYNRANNETFEMLPDSLYTLVGSGFTKTGPLTYQATFAPGEFSKEFVIALNGSKWNLSRKYMLPFTVVDAGGVPISTDSKISTFISIKNKWDGVYEVTGTMVDNANPGLTGLYPLEWHLATSGPTQVIVYDFKYLGGIIGHAISAGGSLSYYGAYGLVVNIDPVTNKITSITNYYGQPSGNGRSAQLDPSGRNEYDPATKTFYVKYWMLQPAVYPSGPRVVFDEVWKYKGPR